jgi:hypothetical protein
LQSIDQALAARDGSFLNRIGTIGAGGLSAFIVALLWGLLCIRLGLGSSSELQQLAQVSAQMSDVPRYVIANIILSPLIETVPFILLLWLAVKLPFGRYGTAFYLAVMLAFGWFLHGASILAVGRGMAFSIVGFVAVLAQQRSGYRAAYIDTAATHVLWNVLGTAYVLLIA